MGTLFLVSAVVFTRINYGDKTATNCTDLMGTGYQSYSVFACRPEGLGVAFMPPTTLSPVTTWLTTVLLTSSSQRIKLKWPRSCRYCQWQEVEGLVTPKYCRNLNTVFCEIVNSRTFCHHFLILIILTVLGDKRVNVIFSSFSLRHGICSLAVLYVFVWCVGCLGSRSPATLENDSSIFTRSSGQYTSRAGCGLMDGVSRYRKG